MKYLMSLLLTLTIGMSISKADFDIGCKLTPLMKTQIAGSAPTLVEIYNASNDYYFGANTPQNYQLAGSCAKTASNVMAPQRGLPIAQFFLAEMYRKGHGTDVDFEQALYWMKQSAEKHHGPAMGNLGWMYQNGKGVDVDNGLAFGWYTNQLQLDPDAPVDWLKESLNELRPLMTDDDWTIAKRMDEERQARIDAQRLAKDQAEQDRIESEKNAADQKVQLFKKVPAAFDRAVQQCFTNGQDLADLTIISLGGEVGSDAYVELIQNAQDACKCKYGSMIDQGYLLSRDNDIMAQDMLNVEKFLGRNQVKMQSPGNRVKQWEVQQDKKALDKKLVYDMSYTANVSGICES